MDVKEILKVRKYKAGYEVREELIDGKKFGGEDFTMKSAYTPNGNYIGNQKDAHYLCVKRGIKPEKASPSHNTCSIGFCEAEQKWYGWSHRAIYGFGIGSKVEKGDCAFVPSNREEYIESFKAWYNDDYYRNVKIEEKENYILITYEIVRANGGILETYSIEPLDITYGKGEWEAKTLEDAKEMAKDFAESVS